MDVYLTILVQTIHDRQPTSIIPATCMATSGDQYCNMQQLFVHALKHKNYELHTCHHQEIRPKQIETMLNGSRPSALQPGGEDMGNPFIRRRLSRVEVCRVSHEWSSPMRMRGQWKWDGFPFCSWHVIGAQDIDGCFAWKPGTKVVSPRLANEANLWCA